MCIEIWTFLCRFSPFLSSDSPSADPTSIHNDRQLHSNENTSVVAARALLYYNGGRLTRIDHNPPGELATRDVTFTLNNVSYTFDPNRMFTPTGAAATLRQLGPYSEEALDAVLAFGKRLLDIYGFSSQRVVVALHDNGPGYSANSYLPPDGPFQNDAAAAYVAPGSDAHNFVFTTSASGFAAMSANDTKINCVLQANRTVTDDGSLSYFAGMHGKTYFNSEVRAASGSYGDAVLAQLDTLQRLAEIVFS